MPSSRPWHRRLRRRLRRARRRLRRRLVVQSTRIRAGLLVLAGLALLGLIWIGVTAMLARASIQDLNNRFEQLRTAVASGDLERAREIAADIPAVAQRGHDLTTGPAWWIASHVPYFGNPLEVARGTARSTGQVGTEVVPQLMSVANSLNPSALRTGGNSVKLAPLAAAGPALERASRAVDRAVGGLRDLPTSTWLGAVDSGRARIATTLLDLRGYVDAAERVSRVLPVMLGSGKPQTYFIGLQNEAEFRGTGGLPGAFAIATARRGVLTFERFESNARLDPPGSGNRLPTGLDFGREYDSAYGAALPTESFVDSNASPNFPYAAKIWAAMWKKVSGQQVDGVLALDPTVLSYFLAATGPAKVRGGTTITADNVVSLLQRDEYVLYANDFLKRKQFIVDVLRAASKRLESGAGTGLALLQAATRSAKEQRLLAWSRDPAIERALVETKYAGTLPSLDRPFAGLVLNNASGGKIDFYVTRSLQYERTGCGATRDVLATIKLTNNAPATGLPPYVADRADTPPAGAKPGDVHQIVDFIGSRGAELLGVSLNGQPTTAGLEAALGRPMFRLDLEIPRGTTQTIVLHLREPENKGPVVIWRQPGVTPLAVQAQQQSCS